MAKLAITHAIGVGTVMIPTIVMIVPRIGSLTTGGAGKIFVLVLTILAISLEADTVRLVVINVIHAVGQWEIAFNAMVITETILLVAIA